MRRFIAVLNKAFSFIALCFTVISFIYGGSAFALTPITECADCYKCVLPAPGGGCYQCEYDEDYCAGEVGTCPDGKKWDSVLQRCVCDPLPVCSVGQTVNEDTCECEGEEIYFCEDGFYWDGDCVACPSATDFTVINNSDVCGGPHSFGIDITSPSVCYYSGGDSCTYKDNSGTFVFVDSCYYSDDSGDTGVVDGSEVIEFP